MTPTTTTTIRPADGEADIPPAVVPRHDLGMMHADLTCHVECTVSFDVAKIGLHFDPDTKAASVTIAHDHVGAITAVELADTSPYRDRVLRVVELAAIALAATGGGAVELAVRPTVGGRWVAVGGTVTDARGKRVTP